MWCAILLAATTVGCFGNPQDSELLGIYSKIFGGASSSPKKVPYMLAVELSEAKRHICAASIIADHWALTAASCVHRRKPEDIRIRSGVITRETGGLLHEVTEIKSHNSYDFVSKDYDVAVVRVENPFRSTAKLLLAKARPEIGKTAVISGWGITTGTGYGSDHVESVEVQVFEERRCNFLPDGGRITDRMLCVGYPPEKPACAGDIGGPLVADDFIQVGIVSKGNGCGWNVRGIYTDVAAVRGWIEDKTEIQSDSESNWDWIWNWEWAWDGDMGTKWKCLWLFC